MIQYDYHVHSTYSDGSLARFMVEAAEDAGLEGIGFADHCNVSTREQMRRRKVDNGFNLDLTYERRRETIDRLDASTDIAVFDGVEVDYDPRDEDAIREFLDEAGFDYALGSVHHLDGYYVAGRAFADRSGAERREILDRYYDQVVELARSELFEVAAHVDLPRRIEHFRGLSTREHYDRVARAFVDSRTIPELNAGRASEGYFHPAPEFVEALREYDVPFTAGTDSHSPEALREAVPMLADEFDRHGLEPVSIDLDRSRAVQ